MLVGERMGFLLACCFLKYFAGEHSKLLKKLSFHFDFDSLKINYFPWCLHFHLLQLGHYVLGRKPWGVGD